MRAALLALRWCFLLEAAHLLFTNVNTVPVNVAVVTKMKVIITNDYQS